MKDGVEITLAALRNTLGKGHEAAHTMPGPYYTSSEFLELERERIFRQQWVCIGREEEVANPGDYFTTELTGEPLLVVRTRAGRIRVLSNVCRHRGTLIASDKGNTHRFVCPYHAWTYDSDGSLLRAPYMDGVPGFDAKTCRLPEFSSEIWQGFLYVNIDGTAEPLAPQLQSLMPLVRNYHMERRKLIFSEETVWQVNWKALAENFMEGYHLSPTHARTLHKFTPTALCEKLEGDSRWTGYLSHYPESNPDRGVYPEELTAEERRYTVMFAVFPNHVVALAPHFTVYMCLRPATADSVSIRWGIAAEEGMMDQKTIDDYIALCHAFNAEDKEKLEKLQQGMHSRYWNTSALAPSDFEGTIWDIYQYIASRMID